MILEDINKLLEKLNACTAMSSLCILRSFLFHLSICSITLVILRHLHFYSRLISFIAHFQRLIADINFIFFLLRLVFHNVSSVKFFFFRICSRISNLLDTFSYHLVNAIRGHRIRDSVVK